MTEAEWLACDNLDQLLEHLSRKKRQSWLNRKLRLFGCACCRRIWHVLTDDRFGRAVEVAERFADGEASLEQLQATGAAVCEIARLDNDVRQWYGWDAVLHVLGTPLKWYVQHAARDARFAAYGAAVAATGLHPAVPAVSPETRPGWPVWMKSRWRGAARAERHWQVQILRDIIGVPSRQTALRTLWPRSPVLELALAAYGARELPSGRLDPGRLAVLSDALEDAGCTEGAILSHLRSPGPHVRGCWALDLVLAKG